MLERILPGDLNSLCGAISSSSIWSRRETARLVLWNGSLLFGASGWHDFSVAEWFCQACFCAKVRWYVCPGFSQLCHTFGSFGENFVFRPPCF